MLPGKPLIIAFTKGNSLAQIIKTKNKNYTGKYFPLNSSQCLLLSTATLRKHSTLIKSMKSIRFTTESTELSTFNNAVLKIQKHHLTLIINHIKDTKT